MVGKFTIYNISKALFLILLVPVLIQADEYQSDYNLSPNQSFAYYEGDNYSYPNQIGYSKRKKRKAKYFRGYQPFDVTAKIGWVNPLSSNLREIYSSFPIYEIEGSYKLCNGWGVWGNLGYLYTNGHADIDPGNCTNCAFDSADFKNKTRLQLLQAGLGINYTFDILCNVLANLGGGVTYSKAWIKNQSPYVHNQINENGWGGIIKSELTYYFYRCFHADLFLDYTATSFDIENFDYSTINFGIGLGASF